MSKLGYKQKLVNGKLYYFSEYSAFSTPHKAKIEKHVAKKRARVATTQAAKKPAALSPKIKQSAK